MKWKTTLNGLHSYKPGKREEQVMTELGLTEITKLSSNENPHGVSEKVADYLKQVDVRVEIYQMAGRQIYERNLQRITVYRKRNLSSRVASMS